MPAPPIPVPELPAPWSCAALARSAAAVSLVVDGRGRDPAPVRLLRCAASRLGAAYPAGAHDIEIRVEGPVSPELLAALVPAVLRADPRCRRVVVAAGDPETLAAATAAGLRPTVEIDLPDGEFTLAVAEPDWVTAVDMDLDRVPGS